MTGMNQGNKIQVYDLRFVVEKSCENLQLLCFIATHGQLSFLFGNHRETNIVAIKSGVHGKVLTIFYQKQFATH
uniref:Uncharacterized protein n=1 Tax=Triticum urartu TaxID=4572 RepID=A0A8R7V106_TRIUA